MRSWRGLMEGLRLLRRRRRKREIDGAGIDISCKFTSTIIYLDDFEKFGWALYIPATSLGFLPPESVQISKYKYLASRLWDIPKPRWFHLFARHAVNPSRSAYTVRRGVAERLPCHTTFVCETCFSERSQGSLVHLITQEAQSKQGEAFLRPSNMTKRPRGHLQSVSYLHFIVFLPTIYKISKVT